jgi:hypothetical protein
MTRHRRGAVSPSCPSSRSRLELTVERAIQRELASDSGGVSYAQPWTNTGSVRYWQEFAERQAVEILPPVGEIRGVTEFRQPRDPETQRGLLRRESLQSLNPSILGRGAACVQGKRRLGRHSVESLNCQENGPREGLRRRAGSGVSVASR